MITVGVAAITHNFVPRFCKLYCTLHTRKEPLGTKCIKEANSLEQPQDVSYIYVRIIHPQNARQCLVYIEKLL